MRTFNRVNFFLFATIFLISCAETSTSRSSSSQSISAMPHSSDSSKSASSGDSSRENFYTKKDLFNGGIEILIPVSFSEMDDKTVSIKYPNAAQKPNIVYTNDKNSVNIAFSIKDYPTKEEDLPTIKQVFDKQLAAANPRDYKSEIRMINGRKFVVYEFVSKAMDTDIFNLMFTTDFQGKLLVGTFNCTEELIGEWKSNGNEIIESIKKK